MTRFAVIEAPSILGLRPTGVELLPEALIRAGLLDRLRARHAGRVTPRTPYDFERDSATLTLNATGIASYSRALADVVGEVIDRGEFPVVLGGDCSILLGNLLALKRRGRYGLLFMDGHADFYNPEANPNGEAASMELALATGHGPDVLVNIEGRGPLVNAEDLPGIRHRGVTLAAKNAVAHLTRDHGPDNGFWLHLDADVLDDAIMPAVDYRLPDGLSWDELTTAMRIAADSHRVVGLEVTIYNPTLDPDGAGARGLSKVIGDAFA